MRILRFREFEQMCSKLHSWAVLGLGSKLRSTRLADPAGAKAPIGPLHTSTAIPALAP